MALAKVATRAAVRLAGSWKDDRPRISRIKRIEGDHTGRSLLIEGTMKRIGESQLQRIIRKTGRKPIQCKCKLCQQQCHTPCLGTPQDILKLIKAGYADRLSWTDWAAGIIMGCTDHVVGMVQATAEGDWCTFFHDGLCELHDKGLKPTEGRLSHHSMRLDNWTPKKSISWNVAKEWEDDDNAPVLEEILDELKKHKEL